MNASRGIVSFSNAPVVKVLAIATLCTTVITLLIDRRSVFVYDSRIVLTSAQSLKRGFFLLLGPSLCLCMRPIALLLALILLHSLRRIEHVLGSAKLVVFVLETIIINAIGCFILALVARSTGSNERPATGQTIEDILYSVYVCCGPSCILSSLMVLFHKYVPSIVHGRILCFRITEKTLIYALWINYLIVDYPYCSAGLVTGLLAGWLFSENVFHFADLRLPRWLSSFGSACILPFIEWNIPAPFLTRESIENFENERRRRRQQQAQRQQGDGQRRPRQRRGPIDIEAFRAAAAAAGDIFAASDIPPGAQQNAPVDDAEQPRPSGSDPSSASAPTSTAATAQVSSDQLVEPDPSAVEVLLSMGIDETLARNTLAACNNSVPIAVNRILDG